MNNLSYCTACNEAIIFVKTKNDKQMPIDFSSISENEKELTVKGEDFFFEFGRHVSHFSTCPDAAKFRKPREKHTVLDKKESTFSPFTKGGDREGVRQQLKQSGWRFDPNIIQEVINTIALWEAARSLKKARVVQRNIIEENRTDFFTPEQNELIDNYTARKQEALLTVLKTFKNLKG